MSRAHRLAILAALLGGSGVCVAGDIQWLGALQGRVRNAAGVPQMGATVTLVNRYEKVVQKTLTNPNGGFRFDSLLPDTYTIRVNLSTFVPASRSGIQVRAGMESFLNIQLANLFSSIELVYTAPGQTGVLSEDWKWVLRSSSATRPVLRYLPRLDPNLPGNTSRSSSAFEITRGLVRVSAGDHGVTSSLGAEPDLGTAFALATSIFGDNQLHVSGNVGYATSTGTPATGFRTRYTRTGDGVLSPPDVELTVRQLGLRQQAGQALMSGPGSPAALPTLRTMSVKLQDRQQVSDELSIDYGVLLESVVFLERLNLLSPFARLSYDLSDNGVVEFGYSSGAPALDLMASPQNSENPLQQDLMGLALFPRISLSEGRARPQQSDNYELGYHRVAAGVKFSGSAYIEQLRNFAMTVAAPAGLFSTADLLPDIASNASIFNMGSFRTWGYMASASRDLLGQWTASLSFGEGGAIEPGRMAPPFGDAAGLRNQIRMARRPWAGARIAGEIPRAGTRIATSYAWTQAGRLTPSHAFLTQRWQPLMGLNLQIRQPLPSFGGVPGRIEMTADLRNLLAQGYIPVATRDNRALYLIQFPRTVRGGVSFIF
jgi:hypothetical protein